MINQTKSHKAFPLPLDPEVTSQFAFQLFNNHKDYTVKVYAKPTEDNGKVASDAKRKSFMLVFPKTPNRQSVNKLKRSYGHVEGINEHCDALLSMSNNNSLFAQCRTLGQKSSYFKFFDAVMTPNHNGVTLTLKVFDDVITFVMPKGSLDEQPETNKSIKLFHFILDNHEFDLDDMTFEPEMLNATISPSFMKDRKTSEKPDDAPVSTEVFDINYSPETIRLGKKNNDASITVEDDKAFIMANKQHLSVLANEKSKTTIGMQLLDKMNKSGLSDKTKHRVLMLQATVRRLDSQLSDRNVAVSKILELQELRTKLTTIIKDIKKLSSFEAVLNGEDYSQRENFYQEMAGVLEKHMDKLTPRLQKTPFLELYKAFANRILDNKAFLTAGDLSTALSQVLTELNNGEPIDEQQESETEG